MQSKPNCSVLEPKENLVKNHQYFLLCTPSLCLGFPCGSAGKESGCNAEDMGSIPGLRISLGEGKGYPLQYSGLENSMDCIVHGVSKSQTRLSDLHFSHSVQKQDQSLCIKFLMMELLLYTAAGILYLTISIFCFLLLTFKTESSKELDIYSVLERKEMYDYR